MVTFLIEASHLFRSGEKFQTQFFVMDVVNFLRRTFYNNTDNFQVVVLYGSSKTEQAERYTAALERFGVKVVRMQPIASLAGGEKVFYKPTWYLHRMMGREIPSGSDIMFIGFHNVRYISFLQKYSKDFVFSMAAFTTSSRKEEIMTIPEDFKPLLKYTVNLDTHVTAIKDEFKKIARDRVIHK